MKVATALLARVAASESERARAEAALKHRFAPSFNTVALLSPGETRMSGIFRWLLDETASHGQGAAFRDRFVADLLGEAPETWNGATVACEIATADGRGRIDLLMQSQDGTRCIVIENKPWAGWQTDQLARYLSDQLSRGRETRVHALIGDDDAAGALERHWASGSKEPLPRSVTACGFDAVAAWLEGCAQVTRADRVRSFLYDLADYCRRFILREFNMTEINDTADLILAGGEESLRAARSIAAAVPLALSRGVAGRLNASAEVVGNFPSVRVAVEGVVLDFVLFGDLNPWVGVTDKAHANQLQGQVSWGTPERLWPRWIYVRKVGEQGRALAQAASLGDLDTIAQLIPVVGRSVIGVQA